MRKLLAIPAASLLALAVACSAPEETSSTTQTVATAEATLATTTLASTGEVDTLYADFLDTYVVDIDGINFIRYGDVTPQDRAELQAYIRNLEAQGVGELSRDEEMAFWINLYNAKTIDIILENYPVSSIRKIGGLLSGGPWDTKIMNVNGIGEMTLNDIEHKTLRANWDEPRIHYAVNCASYGCPNLKSTPWTADTLEEDFEEAAYTYVNHPRGFRVENGRVTASKIYDWYKVDFGGNKAGILEHAREYAEGDLKTALDAAATINTFEYSWKLNEPG